MDHASEIVDRLFWLMPVLVMLLGGSGKALHDAWVCNRLSLDKRFMLVLTSLVIAAVSLAALMQFAPNEVVYALGQFRSSNAIFGWAATITIGGYALMPFLAIVVSLRITADHITRKNQRLAYSYHRSSYSY